MLLSFYFFFLSICKGIRAFIHFYASFHFIFLTNLYLSSRRVPIKTFYFTSTIPIFREKRQLPEKPSKEFSLLAVFLFPLQFGANVPHRRQQPLGSEIFWQLLKTFVLLAYLMVVYTSPSHHSFGFLSISARWFLQVSH